jgi:hypothetical protein
MIDIVNELPVSSTLKYTRRSKPPTMAVIHHSATDKMVTAEQMARYHVEERGWPGIGYHFVVMWDGNVYQTNDIMTISYHAGDGTNTPENTNSYGVGICLVGDFSSVAPPAAQLEAVRRLIEYLELPFIPHKEAHNVSTTCPGNTWPMWKDKLLAKEPAMTNTPSVLSLSFQRDDISKAQVEALVDAGIKRIKCMVYEGTNLSMLPSWMEVEARMHFSNLDHGWLQQGRAGAETWWQNVLLRLNRNPNITAIEGVNEPGHSTIAQLTALDAFSVRQAELCNSRGLRAKILEMPVGNPEMWQWEYLLKSLAMPNVILGLHEYRKQTDVWKPASDDTWWVGRCARSAEAIRGFGGVVPEISIDECGIDLRGGANSDGWLAVPGMTPERGLERLIDVENYYRTLKLKIRSMYPFVTLPFGWASFDHATMNPLLLAYVKASQNPQGDPLLAYADNFVIAMVPGFALWNYIREKSWAVSSGEFSNAGWAWQWGYDQTRNVRVLLRTQAPTWKVEEYATVPN